MFGALVDRERRQKRPVRNLRKMRGLLRRAAAARKRRGREHRGAKKRRRHQRAADLFHHHTGLDGAEPTAAKILRHQKAAKSHLSKGLPELTGKSRGVLAVT